MPSRAEGRRIGRRIDYIGHIRERLQDLSGFDSLANELIQNAEDAHATRISFEVGQDALVVRNDAAFSDCGRAHDVETCPWKAEGKPSCDWHNLTQIAAGQKRDRDDTIGKFGIGFIAVYQLTDRPEVISGRHWALEEDQAEEDRIVECPGCAIDHDAPGTTILLPYARDPNSELRRRLSAGAIIDADLPKLADSLAAAAPLALLFMASLHSVEVQREGDATRRTTTEEGVGGTVPAIIIETDGARSRWYLLGGSFAKEAAALRAGVSDDLIEPNRGSFVSIAIPEDGDAAGRLFAGLPTDSMTGLPFHINSGFFPSTDRKRVIFESNDYKSRWNQAAMAAAAEALDVALVSLKLTLGAAALWTLILRVEKASNQNAALVESLGLRRFRDRVAARVKRSPVAFTAAHQWVQPTDALLLRDAPEQETVSTLAAIGIDPMDPELRTTILQGLGADYGIRQLTADHVVGAILSSGLNRPTERMSAPASLRSEAGLLALWRELERLIAGDRSPATRAGILASLSQAAIAPSGDLLVQLRAAYRSDADGRRLAESLGLEIMFLDEAFVSASVTIVDLCPQLDVRALARAVAAVDRAEIIRRWKAGTYNPSLLLTWLGQRSGEIERDAQLAKAIRALPIYPTADSLVSLDNAVVSGDFEDFPLGLTDLLVLPDLPRHRPVLEVLGVRRLSFVEYASAVVPRAFDGDIGPDVRRDVVRSLARRVHELERDERARSTLSPVALVQCLDGEFRPASEIIIDSEMVASVLGDSVSRASPPELDAVAHHRLWAWLGAVSQPSPDHLLTRIEEIASGPPDGKAIQALETVALHLQGRINELAIRDLILDLKDVAWLPATGDEESWHLPADVYSVFRDYLFQSQGPFLAFRRSVQDTVSRPLLTELGVEAEPPPMLVVRHLLAWAAEGREVNQQVWGYLQQNAGDPALALLRGRPCIWVGGGYRHPAEVFWADHPFGSHRWKLEIPLIVYKGFFDAIGVRDEPTMADCEAVLRDLAATYGDEPLDSDDQTVVTGTWHLMTDLSEGDAVPRSLTTAPAALDRSGRLVAPSRLYFEDRPRMAALFDEAVRLRIIDLDPEAEPALRMAGARDLGEAITVAKLRPGHPTAATELDLRINDRRRPIRRVVALAGANAVRSVPLDEIERVIVDGLEVRYELNDEPGHPATGAERPDALFIEDERRLYVQSGELPVHAVARELAVALSGARAVGTVSPALTIILTARDAASADLALDDLGFPQIIDESAFVAPEMSVATQLGSEADTEPDIAERPDEEMRGDDSDDGDIARRSEDAYTDTVADAGNGTGGGPSSGEPHGKPGHALGEPGEPDTPGTGPDQQPPGGKRGKKPDLPRSVLRSFVGAPRADDAQRDSGMLGQDTEDEGPDVNRAGVDAVLVYERERGRVPKEQRHTNPGYDVLSKSATGEDDRYIEIKSRSDSWVDAQTALSPTQHRMALEYGDRYWLYVVERATSATYEIHAIQNPIGRATHFGFDPGWMAVEEDELIAEPDDGDPSEPVASSTEP